jgi:dienelactone hydrolase
LKISASLPALLLVLAASTGFTQSPGDAGEGSLRPGAAHWQPRPDQAVELIELDTTRLWIWRAAAPQAPWIVALHGCGGMWNRNGSLDPRSAAFQREFHEQGYTIAFVDSFSGRGTREICTQRASQRSITLKTRRADVLNALRWVQGQPGDIRYSLVGWSNGGSTALEVLNLQGWPDTLAMPRHSFVFYPGCESARSSIKGLVGPTQFFLGAADNWTPAAPCIALAQLLESHAPGQIRVEVYPDAVHGFDAPAGEVRARQDVPRGPGQAAVLVGPNPVARADAYRRMSHILGQAFDSNSPGSPPR